MPEKLPDELAYDTTAQEMPEEIKDWMFKYWLPRLVAELLKAVKELPQEQRDRILMRMGNACAPIAIEGIGIKPGMGMEAYKSYMTSLPSPIGPRTIDCEGDVLYHTYHAPKGEDGRPMCMCVLVQLGIEEPSAELCRCCAAPVIAYMTETGTGRSVAKVDMLGVPPSGDECCRFRVHLEP
ncbi:MAG: hypothetical protein JSW38_04655 [Dehalococcoidia bacterium]|nr:MAG: hypothetical protein JSW38_04655 [Dehalococcoidia bacterium]